MKEFTLIGATIALVMVVFDSIAQTNASLPLQPTNEIFLTFTNHQGRVYDNIKVLKILPDGILYTVKDGAGGGKMIYADMPEEYQRMFARMSPFLTEADRKNFEEIKFKAQTGDSQAQAELGRCYANGRGTPTNGVEAVTWFRKAAEQGNAVGENSLGWCYRHGFGVAKNAAEAVRWLIKAAEQGNAKAQCNLGICYEDGFGVPLNAVEAVKWYEKSAAQGFIGSQVKLAILYYQGIGVTKDPAAACKWLELASAHTEEEDKEEARNAKELLVSMRRMIALEPYLNGDLTSTDSSSPVTHASGQTSDTILTGIKQSAAREWPNDYEMQEYTIKKQVAAFSELQQMSAGSIPADVFDRIKADAANEWHGDYEMQVSTIKKQTKAYLNLQK